MHLFATLLLSLAPAPQDDPADPARRIAELVRQLGADEFSVRERASEELKKIGKPAREALARAAQESDDPEVRTRARALVEQMSPRAEAPARPAPPARPPFQGPGESTVLVQSVNGDSTYRITPGNGGPAITFHKGAGGAVKLDYPDEKGESKSADAPSIEAFVKDHSDLAARFGITEEGIDYGGTRVSFKGGLPGFAFPRGLNRGRLVLPALPLEGEGLRAEGATFERVSEALRAQLEIPEGQGLVVSRVDEGGRAQAWGLHKNDILLELDGRKVSTIREVRDSLKGAASATVLRRGTKLTLSPEAPKKDF